VLVDLPAYAGGLHSQLFTAAVKAGGGFEKGLYHVVSSSFNIWVVAVVVRYWLPDTAAQPKMLPTDSLVPSCGFSLSPVSLSESNFSPVLPSQNLFPMSYITV
jgi:hypothetical protein